MPAVYNNQFYIQVLKSQIARFISNTVVKKVWNWVQQILRVVFNWNRGHWQMELDFPFRPLNIVESFGIWEPSRAILIAGGRDTERGRERNYYWVEVRLYNTGFFLSLSLSYIDSLNRNCVFLRMDLACM